MTIRSRKNYGIVHGEFHMDNFFISKVDNDFKITVFNFDHLIKSFYLLDCGSVLHQIFTKLKFPDIELQKQYVDVLCKSPGLIDQKQGYGRDDLRVCMEMRRDQVKVMCQYYVTLPMLDARAKEQYRNYIQKA